MRKKIQLLITIHFICIYAFSQSILSGNYTLLPGDESLIAVRYRTIRGSGQSNAAGDESYLGTPDLGVAINRKQRDFTWGTSSTWNFTFQYDNIGNVLRTIVTDGNFTYQDTIQNISTYIAARGKMNSLSFMRFMNILVRTNNMASTVTLSNLVLNGVALPGSYSATNTVNQWHIPSYNFGAGFIFTGTITTSGTFSASQEGNKVEFTVGGGNSLLPLTWGEVSCHREKENITILWETIDEKDVNSFDIEVSDNGLDFIKVGELKAYNSFNNHYQFTHSNINSIIQYYRIKQIDLDNKFTYSPIQAVEPIQALDLNFVFFENPSSNYLKLVFTNPFFKNISIMDLTGKILFTSSCEDFSLSIPIAHLQKGIYLLSINQTNISSQIMKFIKD